MGGLMDPWSTVGRNPQAIGSPGAGPSGLKLIPVPVNLECVPEDLALKRLVFAELESFFYKPRFRPHPLLERMVEAGLLGRKTGRGCYEYG